MPLEYAHHHSMILYNSAQTQGLTLRIVPIPHKVILMAIQERLENRPAAGGKVWSSLRHFKYWQGEQEKGSAVPVGVPQKSNIVAKWEGVVASIDDQIKKNPEVKLDLP